MDRQCMKSYTDFEQSKKLAEFLPIETADMWWNWFSDPFDDVNGGEYTTEPLLHKPVCNPEKIIPCWSLAALLDVLPISIDDGRHCLALINSNPSGEIEWLCCYEDDNGNLLMECYGDNQVDACVEMVYKLKEKDLL